MIEVIDKYQSLPMVWGQTDCCQFAGECVQSMFGHNPTKSIKYENKRDALKLFADHDGLEGMVTMMLGEPCDEYADGYVGLVDNGCSESLGVFLRDRIICRLENGLVDLPASRAKRIWNPCLR